ncbi:hypothetical protein FZC66_03175 [Priestia megaterium]|nr:hypothetical protein FZC66_03175 [Priestia megaterium]
MNLDTIWTLFFNHFTKDKNIQQVEKKEITRIPFIYVTTAIIERRKIDELIEASSIFATTHVKITWRIEFVRQQLHTYIYRHRFYVPQQKMFCCGNSCIQCVRFQKRI